MSRIALIVMLLAGFCFGATKYLDVASTTGDGSAGDPWGSFTEAGDEATTGDIIMVTGGTYPETGDGQIRFDAGWAGKTLTFRKNGAVPIIVSCSATTGVIALPVGGAATGTFNFEDIAFVNTDATNNARMIHYQDIASAVSATFTRCTFTNTASAANATLFPGGSKAWSLSFIDCTVVTNGCFFLSQSGGAIVIDGCSITTNHTNPGLGAAVDLTYADPAGAIAVYTSVTIKDTAFIAPNLTVANFIIKGRYLDQGLIQVSGCTFGTSAARIVSMPIWFNSVTDSAALSFVIRDNATWINTTVAAGTYTGFFLGAEADTATDTDGGGDLDRITGFVVTGNVFNGAGAGAGNVSGYIRLGPQCSQGGVVAYNQIIGRLDHDIGLYLQGIPSTARPVLIDHNSIKCRSGITLVGSSNLVISHNSVYQDDGANTTAPLIFRDGNSQSPDPSGNIAFGNLLVGGGTQHACVEYLAHTGSVWTPADLIVGNHWYASGGGVFSRELTEYATVNDADGYWDDLATIARLNDSRLYASGWAWPTGDPRFVNAATGDLRLRNNSPAIGFYDVLDPSLADAIDKGAWPLLRGKTVVGVHGRHAGTGD
jgi:hypothetical protein